MAGRGVWLVAAALAVAVVLGVVLWRPGPGGPDGAGGLGRADAAERVAMRLSGAIGRPPGAVSVDVGSGRDGHGNPYITTVVSLAADATPDQVVAVIAGLPAASRRAGLDGDASYRELTFVTAAGARLDVAGAPQVSAGRLRRTVAGWLGVSSAVAGVADVSAVIVTAGDITYRLGLGAADPDDVTRTYRIAASALRSSSGDPTWRTAGWDVSATSAGTALRLASPTAIASRRLDTWTALLADSAGVHAPLAVSRLEVTFGSGVATHLTLLAPDQVADTGFTPARYGSVAGPGVRHQLRTLEHASPRWSYFLSWAHRSSPAAETLLALLFGDHGSVVDRTGRSGGATLGWGDALR